MYKFMLSAIIICFTQVMYSQQPTAKFNTVEIHTSMQCDMCKERVEKKLYKVKGVVSVNVNIPTKIVQITFKTKQTNIENIREAISSQGYDAEHIPANKQAYDGLPDCCKKDGGH